MNQQRPFRFGVLSFGAPSRAAWVGKARQAEALGYSALSIDDHTNRQLAPVAALMAAADATTTLRISALVFANDFRHPAELAREAVSLDVLSEGRFEFGLGTGYNLADYTRTGIPFDSPGVRVSRLAEAVQIITGLFSGEPVSFAGQHYTLQDLTLLARPVQRPHPPLLIGGGSRRILSLAAQQADIVSINVRTTAAGGFDHASSAPEATDEKVAWVRAAAGARFDALELQTLAPFLAVTDQPRPAAEKCLQAWGLAGSVSADQMLAWPHSLFGSVEGIVEALHERRERYGISYFTIMDSHVEDFAPIVARLAGR